MSDYEEPEGEWERIHPEHIEWLEAHDATLHFAAGRKIGLEARRPHDGLRVQYSDWQLPSLIAKARDDMRRRAVGSSPTGSKAQ